MKDTSFRALLLLFVLATACDSAPSTSPVTTGVVVTLVFDGRPADTMRVFVQSPAAIQAARDFVRTSTGPRLMSGTIVRGAGADPRFPFHFLPESIALVDTAIELCDGAPMRTPQAVDEFFLGSTGRADAQAATWCPWSSRPIAIEELATPN